LLAAAVLVGLLGRVASIQKHITADDLDRLARQYTAFQPVMAQRGAIRTREGTVLACSVRMYNLFADPALISDTTGRLSALKDGDVATARQALAAALAPLLEKTPEEVQTQLTENVDYPNGKPRRFLWLAREVDEDFYNRFQALRTKLKEQARQAAREKDRAQALVLAHVLDGVGFVKSTKRQYPMGPLAGQVIGFANNYEGVDGLEHQLNDLLEGRPGTLATMKDAQRHTLLIQDQKFKAPGPGCDVWLTLDAVIQGVAEEELAEACTSFKAESGVAIVLEPMSGRILAMANYPTFDPAHYQDYDAKTRRNKAFDPYEPGSIFKPFIVGWAIETGVVTAKTIFDGHGGRWHDPTGRLVSDEHGYGLESVEDIVVHSSNVGMTQVGWKMGIPRLEQAVRTFGFGERTGVELPGDEKGIVTPSGQWNKGTMTSVSFGYEVAATPLQLVRAFATFPNGGYLVTPRVIEAVETAPGQLTSWEALAGPTVQRQIISARTSQTMLQIMAGVYARGTARSAASKIYTLFGKTGTAHLAIKGAGHYASNEYNASFLAGGPLRQTRLVAIVTLHKPDRTLGYFGGTVAAPACTRILERSLQYLHVPEDQPETEVAARP
jgi:cell division protein FtsI (penicillin-binding protein 3)